MKKRQQGFTLIELMIVIAIIGILASIALPAYQTYTKKSKFTEIILAMSPVKIAFEVCIQKGDATGDCTDGGVTAAGKGVEGARTGAADADMVATVGIAADGTLTSTGTGDVDGKAIILNPVISGNLAVNWDVNIDSTCLDVGYC